MGPESHVSDTTVTEGCVRWLAETLLQLAFACYTVSQEISLPAFEGRAFFLLICPEWPVHGLQRSITQAPVER